jgi:hypothetical protein
MQIMNQRCMAKERKTLKADIKAKVVESGVYNYI